MLPVLQREIIRCINQEGNAILLKVQFSRVQGITCRGFVVIFILKVLKCMFWTHFLRIAMHDEIKAKLIKIGHFSTKICTQNDQKHKIINY